MLGPPPVRWVRRLLFAPLHVQLVVTRRCNLSCTYCNEYDDVSAPVPTDVLKERIDRIAALGTFHLELTGGEPMMHPDILEILRHARRHRFAWRQMITNAYLLNAEKVRALNDAGLTHMQISLDGAVPNATTVKVLRPLKPKLEAVRKNARFRVTLSAVIGAAPPAEVMEVIEYAEANGFRPRVLLLHDGDGQLKLSEEDRRSFEIVRRRLGSRFRDSRDYRTRLLAGQTAPFKCRAGSRYLYVDEHGKVAWCSQTRRDFSKDLSSYGYADLVEQFYTVKGCSDRCTIGCVRTDSRYDQWRSQGRRARVRLPVLDQDLPAQAP